MTFRKNITILLLLAVVSCKMETKESPAAAALPLFDSRLSEPAALELADSVLKEAEPKEWNETRFAQWTGTDGSTTYWDKTSGKVRVESASTIFLFDSNSGKGKVQKDKKELSATEAAPLLDAMVKKTKTDFFEVFLPFQVKAGGVVLSYLGEKSAMDGSKSNVLQLINNDSIGGKSRYFLYVDLKSNKIKSWSRLLNEHSDSVVVSDAKSFSEINLKATLPDKFFEEF